MYSGIYSDEVETSIEYNGTSDAKLDIIWELGFIYQSRLQPPEPNITRK